MEKLWKFIWDLKDIKRAFPAGRRTASTVWVFLSHFNFHHLEQASERKLGKSLNARKQKAIFSANYSSVIELRQFHCDFFTPRHCELKLSGETWKGGVRLSLWETNETIKLTVRVCASVSFRDEHIVCFGKFWTRARRGSHERSTILRLVAMWSQCCDARSHSSPAIVEFCSRWRSLLFRAGRRQRCIRGKHASASSPWQRGTRSPKCRARLECIRW